MAAKRVDASAGLPSDDRVVRCESAIRDQLAVQQEREFGNHADAFHRDVAAIDNPDRIRDELARDVIEDVVRASTPQP
jgi:hypothetical protein